ncbi:MAG: sigma 54-interacting transcriptional regulator [Pyrinomonadaceae bacterium]
MLYTLQNENVNINFLAKLDFLISCLLGETGTSKTRTAKLIRKLRERSLGLQVHSWASLKRPMAAHYSLDEIDELEPNIQTKLVKVVEGKSITQVGANTSRPVNVRIIYATHRDLSVFREDFRYRIAAHSIHLKPALIGA